MEIEINEKLVKRNARIGSITSLIALAILAAGMVISFTRVEWYVFSFGALMLGFLLSQVGIYYTNRWGRRPRPDEQLSESLKGLDGRYRLYHYKTPATHLLVGPAGLWVLQARAQRGTVTFSRGRYRITGGGLMQGYLSLFGQGGLGRPEQELNYEVEAVKKFLGRVYTDDQLPLVRGALIFTSDGAEVEVADDAPFITLPKAKLKEFMRREAKTKPISTDRIDGIFEIFSRY